MDLHSDWVYTRIRAAWGNIEGCLFVSRIITGKRCRESDPRSDFCILRNYFAERVEERERAKMMKAKETNYSCTGV